MRKRTGEQPHVGQTTDRTTSVVVIVVGSLLCRQAWSGGAAGQLVDGTGEGLRGQSERFAHGQVGRPRAGEVLDGEPELDGIHPGQDDVACTGGEGVHVEDLAGLPVGNQLDGAAGVVLHERAGDAVEPDDITAASRRRAAVPLECHDSVVTRVLVLTADR